MSGHLSTNPLQTKAVTSGILSALQEVLASYIAGEKSPSGGYVTSRVPKMAFYGVFLSIGISLIHRLRYLPLSAMVLDPIPHVAEWEIVLTLILQRIFQGKTTAKDKILQILFSNLFVLPSSY